MRLLVERNIVTAHLADVQCNSCGRSVEKDNVGYYEDHVSLSKTWGYHSPFDGEAHAIDLCVNCYRDWIAHFEIPPHVDC